MELISPHQITCPPISLYSNASNISLSLWAHDAPILDLPAILNSSYAMLYPLKKWAESHTCTAKTVKHLSPEFEPRLFGPRAQTLSPVPSAGIAPFLEGSALHSRALPIKITQATHRKEALGSN